MKKIKVIIEKSKDHYSAYSQNVKGIYGAGNTPEEAKKSILKSLELQKKYNRSSKISSLLKQNYELVFQYDVVSFLNYYRRILSFSSLEQMTGIHQKQIQHYSSGLRKPREKQSKKIEEALHRLGRELIAIQLV